MSEQLSTSRSISLDRVESEDIERKVNLELNKFQHKMILFGGILNVLAGLFVVAVLYEKTSHAILFSWFVMLIIADTLNIGFAYKNRHVLPEQTIRWRNSKRAYHIIIGLLCLTYGSVGILYTSQEFLYQLFVITFLQLAFVGFSFGTITDYKACVISNICLLSPFLTYHIYSGIHARILLGYDPNLSIALCLSLLILALFLLIATYFGYKLVRNFFFLSFENIALSQKLENANKFLENRVKERTIELEESLKLVTYQSTHDLLTDLPNQRLLLEYLQSDIAQAEVSNDKFAVACFSINEIEKINDGIGYQAGDKVIKTIALRLQRNLETNKGSQQDIPEYNVTLSRKDVFIIIINNILSVADIEKKSELLFSIIKEPITFDNQIIKVSASMGVSLYPQDGKDTKSLLMNADAAMSLAKKQGGNSLNIYKSEINADVSNELIIESYLHDALKNNEFKMVYQPFLNLRTQKICGGEALIRWNNPHLGQVSPAHFIPLAEANGVIISLGEWTLRTACIEAKKWHDMGFPTLKIAINLSSKQLGKKNIVETIANIIEETQVEPKCIELELTETEAFKKETIPIVKQLKEIGLSLSIDDYGTGYSGLSNLKLFDIDKLKIDQSFVRDIPKNNDSNTIVAHTIDLAKKLNISVLAEGVETKEQLMFLIEHECDMIQGYYFSKPVDSEAFTQLLKNTPPLLKK